MNKDLSILMRGYRKEAVVIHTRLMYKKITTALTILVAVMVAKEFSFYLPITAVSCFWLVMFFRGSFDTPLLEMDEYFYNLLSKIEIQDKEGIESLKELYKEKHYLTLSDVEDFIEKEKNARFLTSQIKNDKVKDFLNKK